MSGRRRGDGGSVTNYFSGLFGRLCNQEELPPPQHEKEEEEGNFPSSKERKGLEKRRNARTGQLHMGKWRRKNVKSHSELPGKGEQCKGRDGCEEGRESQVEEAEREK